MSEPILRLTNVEASYGPVKAIRGVSLEVKQGSIVTVLGANGAGKSTILKTISGILDLQKGSIVFEAARKKLGASAEAALSVVRALSPAEIDHLKLKAGEAKPA